MSSPIAKSQKSGADKLLIAAHQRVSHENRIEKLATAFVQHLLALHPHVDGPLQVLDVGCGDMRLADEIEAQLPSINIRCVDIHPYPKVLAAGDSRWLRYTQFDGENLPFDAKRFDAILFSDVLHHVPPEKRPKLMHSAADVGRMIIIKDHFEYGWISRQTLRAMDFFGNYGYGIAIPDNYFTQSSFEEECNRAGLRIKLMDPQLKLYEHLPLLRHILSPSWHFVASCESF